MSEPFVTPYSVVHLSHEGSVLGQDKKAKWPWMDLTYCRRDGIWGPAKVADDPMQITCRSCIRSFLSEKATAGRGTEWVSDD